VEPAPAGSGITFRGAVGRVPARAAYRVAASRRTALAHGAFRVDTVEHMLAAAFALGYDDLDLTVEGGELPIGDGSFSAFLRLLEEAGMRELAGAREALLLDHPLRVESGAARYEVVPAPSLKVDVTLEYTQPVIGVQRFTAELSRFGESIAPARTFGFLADVQRAQAGGELLGATSDTGIALEPDRVVNTTLRWPDEFVRHKCGDLIGDLALLAAMPCAEIRAVRPSHEGNVACVEAILGAARIVEG
jgi:UDP-3-O-acyl N-acetylglucosamine deacetylase